jgi:hypothetical protein
MLVSVLAWRTSTLRYDPFDRLRARLRALSMLVVVLTTSLSMVVWRAAYKPGTDESP